MPNVWNNDEFTVVDSAIEITFHKGSGTDTDTDRYLGFAADDIIRALIIDPDKNILLISINGEEAKVPRTIRGDKGFTRSGDSWLKAWNKFTIRTVNATTKITVTAFTQ